MYGNKIWNCQFDKQYTESQKWMNEWITPVEPVFKSFQQTFVYVCVSVVGKKWTNEWMRP